MLAYTVKPVLVATSLYNTGYLCIVAMCFFSREKVEREMCVVECVYKGHLPIVATFYFP